MGRCTFVHYDTNTRRVYRVGVGTQLMWVGMFTLELIDDDPVHSMELPPMSPVVATFLEPPKPAPATELTPTTTVTPLTVVRQYGYLNEFKKPMTIAQRATVNERTYVSVFHGIDANYGGDVFQFNTLTHAHFFRAEKKANHVYVWMDTATKVDWKPTHIPEVLKRIA